MGAHVFHSGFLPKDVGTLEMSERQDWFAPSFARRCGIELGLDMRANLKGEDRKVHRACPEWAANMRAIVGAAHGMNLNETAELRGGVVTALQGDSVQPSIERGRFSAVTSTGHVYFWQGGSLWIGEGQGRTQWHKHYAHQLAIALSGSFRFRTEADGAWTDYEGAIVPSECTHQFEVDGAATMAHLFVEPESSAGRALTARFGSNAVAELPAAGARAAAKLLFEALQSSQLAKDMVEAAMLAISELCGTATRPDNELDPRLSRALDYIRSNVRNPVSLSDVASTVALSESRFRHLFVAGTGSSFRAYLLWLRINLAIEAVMSGASWTEAAHEAGFADSAHLTRTHKRMFGIEPTALRPQPPG